MEKDDEIKGEGNVLNTDFRKYDPRIGRWFSLDPKSKLTPFESPYSFSNNMPTVGSDPDGDICVPCVIIILALMTAPDVAMAPTLDSEKNSIAFQKYSNLKTQWILTGITAGGLASGGSTSSYILNELKGQLYVQLGVNTINESIDALNGDGFSPIDILTNSLSGLDVFDAAIGKFQISGKIGNLDLDKIKNVVASALIDLSPEEINVLGLSDKDGTEFGVDVIFNALSEFTDSKLAKAKLGKTVKEILNKMDNIIQGKVNEELKEQLGEDIYNELNNEIDEMFKKTDPRYETKKVQENTKIEKPEIPDLEKLKEYNKNQKKKAAQNKKDNIPNMTQG